VVIRSACIAAIVIATSSVALYAAATVVNLSKIDIFPEEQTMIWAAKNMMPPLMGALLLAGVTAAAFSSATTFLSLVGFSMSQDIFPHHQRDDQSMLRFSRAMMLLVGAVTLVISLFLPPSVFWLVYYVGTIFASSWGAVGFMSVWSNKITARAAYWGIISGFVGNVIPRLLDTLGWIDLPSYLNPIVIGGVISLVVVLSLSHLGSVTDVQRARRLTLHEVPEEDRDTAQARKTQWSAIGVALSGIFMTAMLLRFYVLPYQRATDTLREGGGLDWWTVEALLAMTWAGLFVPWGIMAYKMIGHSYSSKRPR
jgi:sodium/pantothenate symporter